MNLIFGLLALGMADMPSGEVASGDKEEVPASSPPAFAIWQISIIVGGCLLSIALLTYILSERCKATVTTTPTAVVVTVDEETATPSAQPAPPQSNKTQPAPQSAAPKPAPQSATPKPAPKPPKRDFPARWGTPPEEKATDEQVKLPGRWGVGSPALSAWIRANMKQDEQKGLAAEEPKPPVAKKQGALAPNGKRFPARWGAPPTSNPNDDQVDLPNGWGKGSTTLRAWIRANQKRDEQKQTRDELVEQDPRPVFSLKSGGEQ